MEKGHSHAKRGQGEPGRVAPHEREGTATRSVGRGACDAEEYVGRNPTDRGKAGVKKSILIEGSGGPLAVCIAGANAADITLLEATLDAVVVERPEPSEEEPQHLCLDKAYDSSTGYGICEQFGYTPHIRRIGEEKKDEQGEKKFPARHWVVERTLAWLSKCGGILVRYDKKAECYLAQVKLACALLWFRRLHRLQCQKKQADVLS